MNMNIIYRVHAQQGHIVSKLIKISPADNIMISVHLIHFWQFYYSFHNSQGCYWQLSKLSFETTVPPWITSQRQ